MAESLEPTKNQPDVEELVKNFQSTPHGIGDTANNFARMRAILGFPNPEYWKQLPPAQTYAEYITWKYRGTGAAEAIIAATDESFKDKYNAYAERSNRALAQGVQDAQQASVLISILNEANAFISKYCRTLPGYTGQL